MLYKTSNFSSLQAIQHLQWFHLYQLLLDSRRRDLQYYWSYVHCCDGDRPYRLYCVHVDLPGSRLTGSVEGDYLNQKILSPVKKYRYAFQDFTQWKSDVCTICMLFFVFRNYTTLYYLYWYNLVKYNNLKFKSLILVEVIIILLYPVWKSLHIPPPPIPISILLDFSLPVTKLYLIFLDRSHG